MTKKKKNVLLPVITTVLLVYVLLVMVSTLTTTVKSEATAIIADMVKNMSMVIVLTFAKRTNNTTKKLSNVNALKDSDITKANAKLVLLITSSPTATV